MPPHCDAKDGPVVTGALTALDTGEVNEALRFSPKDAENEIRAAFTKAVQARSSSPAAREVADLYFAETVVRLHRAGEGAAFTGLKPVGLDVGPVIPLAEHAIETGSGDELVAFLSDTLHEEVKERLERVLELKAQAGIGLVESREYTTAMLGLQVWSHKLYGAMKASPHEGDHEHA
jgi:hypothetical protein